MPIRTNRGRAAVYRKLWGWPLRSPRHLAIAAFIAALVITGAGIVIPKLTGSDTPRAAGSPSTSATMGSNSRVVGSRVVQLPPDFGSESARPSQTRVEPTLTPSPAAADPRAVKVATDWAGAWVRHPEGITAEAWQDQLRPYTTEEYMVKLTSTDPRNIPATEVTGEPRVVVSYQKSVVLEIPTDGPLLRLTTVETDAGWRVSEHAMGEG
ncbi:hypothetical protein ACTG9Q_08275 [Actinokineospora sp. 24-640]